MEPSEYRRIAELKPGEFQILTWDQDEADEHQNYCAALHKNWPQSLNPSHYRIIANTLRTGGYELTIKRLI